MTWTKNANVLGTATCTQFTNTAQDELNPQTAYQTAPFITSNTTTTQTITFNYFDTFIKDQTGSTKTLVATSTSGLTVSFTSLNTNVATILGTTLTAVTAGTVYIQATQAGNATYNPATPVICILTITLANTVTGPTGKIQYPIVVLASTLKPNSKTITIVIDDIKYTQYAGISYGYNTGFHGSAMIGSITCTDGSSNPITDFSDYTLNVTITMANANTAHVYKIWKRSGSTIIDPQPTGYPVTLTYVSGSNWTGSMSYLSEIIILDDTPPAGDAGGDPYIISVKKVKTLLPNNWSVVKLLDTETTSIIANCDFIDSDIISNLHFINKAKQACMKIDPIIHKWVKDLTYIKTLEFINKKTDKKLVLDTINGRILLDNSGFLYETIKETKYGLFSITHTGYYPHVAFKQFIIHFDEGYLVISIDNYWDDINYMQLFMHDTEYINYSGELIEHNIENALFIKE